MKSNEKAFHFGPTHIKVYDEYGLVYEDTLNVGMAYALANSSHVHSYHAHINTIDVTGTTTCVMPLDKAAKDIKMWHQLFMTETAETSFEGV